VGPRSHQRPANPPQVSDRDRRRGKKMLTEQEIHLTVVTAEKERYNANMRAWRALYFDTTILPDGKLLETVLKAIRELYRAKIDQQHDQAVEEEWERHHVALTAEKERYQEGAS